MHACWLLDGDVFQEYRDELVRAVESQGHSVRVIHSPKAGYTWDDEGCSYRETFPAGACVIVHGDIDLSLRVRNEQRWIPGAYASVENFACSRYFSELGDCLLNGDYIVLPFGELVRCQDLLFRSIGKGDSLFIRPDSPLKLFTGQLVRRATFAADVEYLGFCDFPRHSLVVVSSPKALVAEWRFVVVDRQVIAGSQYKEAGQLVSRSGYDPEAFRLASRIAAGDFQPDPVWVMDICKTGDGHYRLLEIGAFSFANLYACDKVAVVAAVSQAAMRDRQQ